MWCAFGLNNKLYKCSLFSCLQTLVPKSQALGLLGNYLFHYGIKYSWVLRKHLLHVTLQASRIWRWLQNIWKIYDPVH
jgi:hypothetical protein